jgi:CTP:molybdopterin cytidylyltransferase MocA
MQVAAIILAAGASTRFGSPKQLARLRDRTMLETVAAAAAASGLGPVIAVVPPGMAVPPDVVPEVNGAPAKGLSHSLRLGLAAVPSELDAALILLGDQPTVTAATIRAVLAAGESNATRSVVAASAEGRLGPPVLLRRDAFTLAERASGDEGLRSVLVHSPERVVAVEVAQHAPDVDTPGDLARIAHMFDSAQSATDR